MSFFSPFRNLVGVVGDVIPFVKSLCSRSPVVVNFWLTLTHLIYSRESPRDIAFTPAVVIAHYFFSLAIFYWPERGRPLDLAFCLCCGGRLCQSRLFFLFLYLSSFKIALFFIIVPYRSFFLGRIFCILFFSPSLPPSRPLFSRFFAYVFFRLNLITIVIVLSLMFYYFFPAPLLSLFKIFIIPLSRQRLLTKPKLK